MTLLKFIKTGLLLLAVLLLSPASVRADVNNIMAESYILMDAASGQVILAKNEHQHLPPASMTKLMTLILAIEALDQGEAGANDQVSSSPKAAKVDGTRINLKTSEAVKYEDLLIAMVLRSANDASIAIAEHLAGSEKNFVVRMNEKSKKLGLKDTQFKNVTGLPAADHYSSAYDMAVIARYALTKTRVTDYTSLKEYNIHEGEVKIRNTNKLLWQYPGADGLKTGWTSSARHCLAASATRGNLQLIAIVMASPMAGGHFADATQLLDYGFNQCSSKVFYRQGVTCGQVKVKGGERDSVTVTAAENACALIVKGQEEKFSSRLKLASLVQAPVKKGQKLGEILISNGQEPVRKVNLLASQNVQAAGIKNHSGSAALIFIPMALLLVTGIFLYARKCQSK